MGSSGGATTADLVRLLADADDPARASRVAFDLLQSLFDGGDIGLLRPLLRREGGSVLDAAAWVMSELGVAARPLLEEAASILIHGSRKARFWAIDTVNAAARDGDGDVICRALSLAADPDTLVREKAVEFLSRASDVQLEAARRAESTGSPVWELLHSFDEARQGLNPDVVRRSLSTGDELHRLATAASAIHSRDRFNIEALLDSEDELVVALAARELALPRWRVSRRPTQAEPGVDE